MKKKEKKKLCLFSSLNCLTTGLNRYQSQYRGGRGPGQTQLGTGHGLQHSNASCRSTYSSLGLHSGTSEDTFCALFTLEKCLWCHAVGMMACVVVLFLRDCFLILEVSGSEKFGFARRFCSHTGGLLCPRVCGLIGTKTSQPVDVELGQLFGTQMVISCLLNVGFIKIYK